MIFYLSIDLYSTIIEPMNNYNKDRSLSYDYINLEGFNLDAITFQVLSQAAINKIYQSFFLAVQLVFFQARIDKFFLALVIYTDDNKI